jgi:hypothetical protein
MSPNQGSLKLEGWAGIEPANTGFADPRVSHFATSPLATNSTLHGAQDCLRNSELHIFRPKIENPPASANSGGGYIGDGSLLKCFSPAISSRQNASAHSSRLRNNTFQRSSFSRSWSQLTSWPECNTRLADEQGGGGISHGVHGGLTDLGAIPRSPNARDRGHPFLWAWKDREEQSRSLGSAENRCARDDTPNMGGYSAWKTMSKRSRLAVVKMMS